MRGFQSLANLNKLGRMLRAFQGDTTFSQVVDLLGAVDEEGLAESESRLMEERSNAVRIMTIHKAKGLDFPIVFVPELSVWYYAQAQLHGSAIRLALMLYQCDHDRLPETLDALVSMYLPSLPADPYSGGPFQYRVSPGERLLMRVI